MTGACLVVDPRQRNYYSHRIVELPLPTTQSCPRRRFVIIMVAIATTTTSSSNLETLENDV